MEGRCEECKHIWDYYYTVKVPYLQSRTINDVKMFGTNITGIPAIDNDLKNQLITTEMPISKMVDHYKDGVAIYVVKRSDILAIYEAIEKFLYYWKNFMHRGINIGGAPMEDLLAADKFANSIYQHAKYDTTEEYLLSPSVQYLSGYTSNNSSRFFNSDVLAKLNSKDDGTGITRINHEEEYPERSSLSEFFKDKLINFRR